MTERIIAFVALALCCACGSTPPTSPSAIAPSTTTRTFAVYGSVTDYQGAVVSGAILEILDGNNEGERAVTDVQGRYSFGRLQAGGFTILAAAIDHATATKQVMLTADTSLEFQLSLLGAEFVIVGALTTTSNPDGTMAARGQSLNIGAGCAAEVSGAANFRDVNGAIVTTLSWSLPPTTVVRPGEQVSYDFCCVTHEQAIVITNYDADFRGTSVRCS
jgi:hypothetical protein